MATYVAMSSLDGGASRFVVLIGHDGEAKVSVEERASRAICGDQWNSAKDIYVDTQLKNLVILPMSTVKRRYASDLDAYYRDGVQSHA